jgi:N-acyl-D-aspartate/D-glutamate deacylase
VGYFADIVVFDPQTFRDTATYERPLSWATGTKLVLVNGQIAVEEEKPTARLAGRAIRHPVASMASAPAPPSAEKRP